jgi:hypothetical protein
MAKGKSKQSSTPHSADSHDLIRVHGARVNNFKRSTHQRGLMSS